jgi:hypothetical protein
VTPVVTRLIADEEQAGLDRLDPYLRFRERAEACRDEFVEFLGAAHAEGQAIAAYGAAAKGATLLNYAGATAADIEFAADRNPHKHGRVMPGSAIPIVPADAVVSRRLPYLLILPWNLRDEIAGQLAAIRAWGGRFVTAVPGIEVWSS